MAQKHTKQGNLITLHFFCDNCGTEAELYKSLVGDHVCYDCSTEAMKEFYGKLRGSVKNNIFYDIRKHNINV